MNIRSLILLLVAPSVPVFAWSPYLSKVYEYAPAPGQFINMSPKYEDGDTESSMLEKVQKEVCGDKKPGLVSLGAFGGYIIVGFDHPVINVKGESDFKIYGNCVTPSGTGAGSAEPAVVYVSVDVNGNGIPDDEWYELRGSEYDNPATRHNLEIVYYRPDDSRPVNADPDPDNEFISDRTYIRFTDSDGREEYVQRNTFHKQSYWPKWHSAEQLTFKGCRLPDNYIHTTEDGEQHFVINSFDWGYADNLPESMDVGFNIENAVDEQGCFVHLSHVDFIKVQTSLSESMGWVGEASTEVCGGEDLHPDATGITDVEAESILRVLEMHQGVLTVYAQVDTQVEIYSLDGMLRRALSVSAGRSDIDLRDCADGLYLLRNGGKTIKVLLSRF